MNDHCHAPPTGHRLAESRLGAGLGPCGFGVSILPGASSSKREQSAGEYPPNASPDATPCMPKPTAEGPVP